MSKASLPSLRTVDRLMSSVMRRKPVLDFLELALIEGWRTGHSMPVERIRLAQHTFAIRMCCFRACTTPAQRQLRVLLYPRGWKIQDPNDETSQAAANESTTPGNANTETKWTSALLLKARDEVNIKTNPMTSSPHP